MDTLHQSQATLQDDSLHNEAKGEPRSDPSLGVIDGENCDMVIELGLESGGSGVVENLGDSDDDDDDVYVDFEESDEDDLFLERRRDFELEFHEIASMESDIGLITAESCSDDGVENVREIWGIDLNEEDDDDEEDDVSVTIPLCWDSLQLEDHRVTTNDYDWEEVDGNGDAEEREIHSGFTEVWVPDSPFFSFEDLERAERDHGWEVLLNHTQDNNFEVENRDLYSVGDHDDYIRTTEYEMLFEQFTDTEISVLGLPPASKSFLKNLLVVQLEGEKGDDDGVVCAVCKDEMNIGNKVVQLPCDHKYHSECIVPWLKVRNTCPVCRFELPTDDEEYEQRKIQRRTTTFGMVL